MFSHIIYLGTDPQGHGGMATVMRFYQKIAGEKFRFICVHRFEGKLFQLLRAIRAYLLLLGYCTLSSVKLIHIQTASYHSFYRDSLYLLLAKLFKKKVILHLHGGEFELFYRKSPRYCSFICRKADCIVGVSEYFVKVFRTLDLNENIICLYNPISSPSFSLTQDRYRLVKSHIDISFLGTINQQKGIFDILECWKLHRDYFSNRVHLHIGGIGEVDKLHSLVKEYGLEGLTTYHGWLENGAKEELWKYTDIYLQPSHFESFGIAILEAMSHGIPVIASNVGGIPELVQHGDNGILIEPANTDQLFEAIKNLIEIPEERKRMGDIGLKRSTKFYEKNIEGEIKKLYSELLA